MSSLPLHPVTASGLALAASATHRTNELGWYDVTAYGAVGDGVTDDSAAIQAAITDASGGGGHGGKVIYFPARSYRLNSSLTLNDAPALMFLGSAKVWGTSLNFYGTGALFENGADDGNAYDANEYNGNEGVYFRDIQLVAHGSTPLANGQGNYLAGSIAIRDWRGGDIGFDHVKIQGFETGFWGIQSDVNSWRDVTFLLNKTGAYVGPRSDQLTCGDGVYFIFNDRAIDLDSCWGVNFNGSIFVDNGAPGINPIRIRSQFTRAAQSIHFNGCWFEHLIGQTPLEAFIEVGVGDTNQARDIVIRNATILTNDSGGPVHMKYLVKTGNVLHVEIDNPMGSMASGLESLLYHVDTSVGVQVYLKLPRDIANTSLTVPVLGPGAATANVARLDYGSGIIGFHDGSGGRACVDIRPSSTFPIIGFTKSDGTVMFKITGSLNDAGQMWIDAPQSTSQFHIRDHLLADIINAHCTNGLTLGKSGGKVGFYGTSPGSKPTVSGSRGGNAALASLLSALATLGLITDSSSA